MTCSFLIIKKNGNQNNYLTIKNSYHGIPVNRQEQTNKQTKRSRFAHVKIVEFLSFIVILSNHSLKCTYIAISIPRLCG